MKKGIIFIAALIGIWAFAAPEEPPVPNQIIGKFLQLIQHRPQEKVYLHTDRDHYEAGDKVWFRAYLTNSYTHKNSLLSQFVYVELRDRQDSLYARLKIAPRDTVFAGYMPLQTNLAQGEYFLRAYTYWMQNDGDEYIFRKKIRVVNPRDTKVKTEISFEENDKGKFAKIRFFNSRQEAYGKTFIEYIQNEKTKVARTNDEGYIQVKLDSANYGQKMFVRFKGAEPFYYEHYLYLPDPRQDFDVAFMPEGGDLLEGIQQAIAFKAIGKDGLSREVSGMVLNSKDEQVAFVQSLHKGMGAFSLPVEPGERYYALLNGPDSIQKRFDLPVPKSDAITLQAITSTDVIGYTILAGKNAKLPEDLYIMAHIRGVPVFCEPAAIGVRQKILTKDLPEGILHLLVTDSKGEVYTQRLCFIYTPTRPQLSVRPGKQDYQLRDLIQLNIQVNADSLQPLEGSFSLAVTDENKTERDSLSNHILSSFLLTSDIKGYVEDPAWYFKDFRVSTRRYLDLLMMTQGWTRFDVSKVIRQEYDSLAYYLERGQAISGKVKNFWGKDATNANLILLSTSGLFRLVEADSTGHFVIDGIAFPDSTQFVLQGKNRKGRRNVEVIVDQDEFMQPTAKFPFGMETAAEEDDFYKRFTRDYYYDNGIKVYVLDEAVVKRKVHKKTYSFYDNLADYNLDSAKLASMGSMDMKMVLQELPGVDAWGDSVTRFGKPVYMLLNDFEEDLDRIMLLQPQDLVSISFIRPPTSTTFWGQKAANGAIVITTNPNFVPRDLPKPNMVTFSLLGYQKKAEFYMPRYEVDSIRLALADSADLRTTIYWNANLRTDASGKASCSFTASDSHGPYRIVIEGILKDGTVCRKEEKLMLKTW